MTYEELEAAFKLSKKIDRLEHRLMDLQAGGIGSPSYGTVVKGGGKSVGVGQIAVELSQEIEELKHQREIEQTIIQRYIDKLELATMEKTILILRYVRCLSWKLVETATGYSRSRVFQIHERALQKIGLR